MDKICQLMRSRTLLIDKFCPFMRTRTSSLRLRTSLLRSRTSPTTNFCQRVGREAAARDHENTLAGEGNRTNHLKILPRSPKIVEFLTGSKRSTLIAVFLGIPLAYYIRRR